jgi:hypothetical protein
MAPVLFLAGLAALVTGAFGLLGVWWALVLLGLLLVGLGILQQRADATAEPPSEDTR